ncbi:MAG: DNA recombination protein RmuC, partial [Clostridia bacterium]|nr:DNA recombination protein RmuC [Clostridia bacterium]
KNVLLPIDAKFPMEDYVRLTDAIEKGDAELISKSQKALEQRIKEEAKEINKKYICVPNTTDFAIMYLATEGLYSEVIKNSALATKLQQENKILICGPTTLSALLNSLQMGFKTLAIEKRSAEIWNMLSVFRKEFSTYVELLDKTQKKLNEASNTIEDAAKKSIKISKQLSKVEGIADVGENSDN